MEISGIFTAIVFGLIIGALGRLVVPGKQKIALWLTLLIGIIGAFVGTFLASLFGWDNTSGVDWLELVLQVVVAAFGVMLVSRSRSRS